MLGLVVMDDVFKAEDLLHRCIGLCSDASSSDKGGGGTRLTD
jgi:hypothetical protein